ncbi:MAG: gliding motility protein GldN [Prevotella sp.]|nr:gliding motility protein GldN [Prevotella sp.]
MKKLFVIILISAFGLSVAAQPAARRAEQQAQATKSNANNLSTRAQISYPTALSMDEDVVWRRDIYREIDLNDPANAGLYYPEEPIGDQQNLFTYLFKLMLTGKIKVYEYRLDGNEVFNDSARVKPLDFMDNYGIYYERNGKSIHIDNSDIPSRDVTAYYLKESAYYDQASSSFHKKVIALCPIIKRMDDFGDGATPYPLFWVKYDDVAPFLSKQTIMVSDLNNAATMSVDDYFTKNQYSGKIYKTTNMLGRTLAQVAGDDIDRLTAEQRKIEEEIEAFERNLFASNIAPDSLDTDSIATDSEATGKHAKKNARTSRTTSVKKTKSRTSHSSSVGGEARVSARRERH